MSTHLSIQKERNFSLEQKKSPTLEDRSPTFLDPSYIVECPLHHKNYLTNICVAEGCVEPLCPECVSRHIDLHNEMRSNAKIETLSIRRQETIKNLTDLLSQFQQEKKKLWKHSDQQRNEIAQHYFNKISKARSKIIQIVDGYFETLNQEVKKDMEDHFNRHPGEFKHLSQRLDSIIGTLEKQLTNLKTPNYIKSMLKFQSAVMHQDYEALKRQIDDAIEAYTSDIKKVVLDESKLYSLNIELNKFIYLKGGKEGGEGWIEKPLDDRLSFIEKAFAIQDITNEFQNQNVSKAVYEKSPQKVQTTNLSMYNFSESKMREYGKGNNREEVWKDKLTQNYSHYFPKSLHKF